MWPRVCWCLAALGPPDHSGVGSPSLGVHGPGYQVLELHVAWHRWQQSHHLRERHVGRTPSPSIHPPPTRQPTAPHSTFSFTSNPYRGLRKDSKWLIRFVDWLIAFALRLIDWWVSLDLLISWSLHVTKITNAKDFFLIPRKEQNRRGVTQLLQKAS